MNEQEIELLGERIGKMLSEVYEERIHQLEKWGDQRHGSFKWIAIATEELGEAARAALEINQSQYYKELIQTAAVCVAAAEDMVRKNEEAAMEGYQ